MKKKYRKKINSYTSALNICKEWSVLLWMSANVMPRKKEVKTLASSISKINSCKKTLRKIHFNEAVDRLSMLLSPSYFNFFCLPLKYRYWYRCQFTNMTANFALFPSTTKENECQEPEMCESTIQMFIFEKKKYNRNISPPVLFDFPKN